MQQEGIAVLVEHVRGDGLDRALVVHPQRLDREIILPDADQHAAFARMRRAQRAALGDLAGVPGLRRARAAHQRHRGEYARIGRTAAQDDVSAGLERSDVGFRPHQGDDVVADGELFRRNLFHRRERGDFPFAHLGDHPFGGLLGVDDRDARRQAVFAGDFQGDVARPLKRQIAARGAARADEQRNPGLRLGAHQDRQIVLDRITRVFGDASGEVSRTTVG